MKLKLTTACFLSPVLSYPSCCIFRVLLYNMEMTVVFCRKVGARLAISKGSWVKLVSLISVFLYNLMRSDLERFSGYFTYANHLQFESPFFCGLQVLASRLYQKSNQTKSAAGVRERSVGNAIATVTLIPDRRKRVRLPWQSAIGPWHLLRGSFQIS